jgi:hypothetical protein
VAKKFIEIKEGRIPLAAIKALTPEQRFTYYLLGLIYNETLLLRKIIVFSLSGRGDERAFRVEPEFSQTFFFFRIACSKVHEARLALELPQVKSELLDLYKSWPEGRQEQREVGRMLASAKWLATLRKRIGFHYPNFHEWRKLTTPNAEWGDEIIWSGEHAPNQFLYGAESLSRAWIFGDAVGATGQERMEHRTHEMVKIVSAMNDFITHAIDQFIFQRLPGGTSKSLGRVSATPMRQVRMPFWVGEVDL